MESIQHLCLVGKYKLKKKMRIYVNLPKKYHSVLNGFSHVFLISNSDFTLGTLLADIFTSKYVISKCDNS